MLSGFEVSIGRYAMFTRFIFILGFDHLNIQCLNIINSTCDPKFLKGLKKLQRYSFIPLQHYQEKHCTIIIMILWYRHRFCFHNHIILTFLVLLLLEIKSTVYNYIYYFANLYTCCTLTIVLFACVFLSTLHASLAVYAATPVKLASALPGFRELMCVVAATAAH